MTKFPKIAKKLSLLCGLVFGLSSCDSEPEKPSEPALEVIEVTEALTAKDMEWKEDKYFYKGKLLSGPFLRFYKDGVTKMREGTLKAGVFHGVYREWWENGQLKNEANFDSGVRHGDNRYWDKEGKLTKEQVYKRGESVSVKEY